ncbi:MAG: hypothetical protein QOF29_2093 [bacterium]|jgi:hypothetical protein
MTQDRASFSREDPRETGVGDQMPEENPEDQDAQGGERQGPQSDAGGTRAPSTSKPGERDPRKATGNPNAAG